MQVTFSEALKLLLSDPTSVLIVVGLGILAIIGLIYGAILVYKGSHY